MPTTPRKTSPSRKASAPRKRTTAPAEAETVLAHPERSTAEDSAMEGPGTGAVRSARSAPGAGHVIASVVTFPVTAVRGVAEDVVSTARRPEALAYWGGLAGLAVLGALEWPVAAAVGVGVAIANGRRRSRS